MTTTTDPSAASGSRWRDVRDSLACNTLFVALLLIIAVTGYVWLKWEQGGITQLVASADRAGATASGLTRLVARHGATLDGIVSAYGVRVDAAGGDLRLDQPAVINLTGFERLPAFHGVLLACDRRLAAINQAGATLWRDLMMRWRDGERRRLLIPMGELDGRTAGTLEVPLPDTWRESVPTLAHLDELAQRIAGAGNILHVAPPANATPPTTLAEGMRGIATTWAPATRPADAELANLLRTTWSTRLATGLGRPLADGGTIAGNLAVALDQGLKQRLREVIDEDLGIFWLFGWLRWFEVWAWCMFGVLAGALYHQGQFLMGWSRRAWTPRGTLHVVLQIFHVPLMSLAVFWLFSYVTASQAPLDLVRSTPALLAYAFIFGLFPYMAYDLLRKATSQLRDSMKTVPDQIGTGTRTVPVPPSPPSMPGQPPHVGDLRRQLTRIATAPIE